MVAQADKKHSSHRSEFQDSQMEEDVEDLSKVINNRSNNMMVGMAGIGKSLWIGKTTLARRAYETFC